MGPIDCKMMAAEFEISGLIAGGQRGRESPQRYRPHSDVDGGERGDAAALELLAEGVPTDLILVSVVNLDMVTGVIASILAAEDEVARNS